MTTKLLKLRVNTFTYPIKRGTPVNQFGNLCNGTGAVGVIASEIPEPPVSGMATIVVAGELELASYQATYGQNYETEALKSMDGITWLDANGTRTPDPYHDMYVLPAATTAKMGGVKQAANVADAAGDAPTAAEFKALLDALKTAGIMVPDATE